MRKYSVDWRLLGGFGALLFFIVIIGAIGIFQIQSLSETVDALGKSYLPMQRAILEMKTNNGLYAMRIRNYIFWKNSKYLEAASAGANLRMINAAAEAFDRNLAVYSSHIQSDKQRQWAERISASQQELRAMGKKIIGLVDQLGENAADLGRKGLDRTINKAVMVFENELYKINDFIEKNLEKDNLELIKEQLSASELTRNQAISFLGISLVIVLLIGSQTAWFVYRDRRRERQRREQLVQKMIRIEEEQRKHLSMQIHDQMGQDLSGLKINLDIINKELPRGNEKLKRNIHECKKILSDLIEKGHNISEFLRPPALEEVGFLDTIGALILQQKQRTGIKFIYQKPKTEMKLSGEHSLFFYRVVQEGLTNMIKYSQAKSAHVKLEVLSNAHRLSIQDDGKGFDYKKLLRERARGGKLGLTGLEERAELLGGSMTIDTAPGKGMKLIVQLPRERS
ncbi:MAG: hypothetical protein DRP85_07520 [Candidatus Makaraimicrobium thalassicum]|nr:MAG: hypothetical protein DRP85_07520 [Candidatus Omnitrophota bacterium]